MTGEAVNSIAALDALLGGNTPPPAAPTEPPAATDPATPPATEDVAITKPADGGGDPNLEPPAEPEPPADGGEAERAKQNAAFAKLRAQNAQLQKTMDQLSKALGIDDKDPEAKANKLLQMAQEKLAQQSSLPVEVFNKLQQTEEELAVLRQNQNAIAARDKFFDLQKTYELDQNELVGFAKQLDEAGINVALDPSIDLEYHYYRLNRAKIEEKRIAAAVQAALTKSNTAENQGSATSKQRGKAEEPNTDAKVNNVAALNALLNGK